MPKAKLNPRRMMERAIEVMRRSVAEPRADGKASPLVGAVLVLPDGEIIDACRGELREGNWADLVVFNPDTVTDHATYKDPHHYATGFKYVFVNGVMVVENDSHVGARPGMTLRHNYSAK